MDVENADSREERDFGSVLNTSHHSSAEYTLETPESVIFATNNSCALAPEAIVGPYCKWGPIGLPCSIEADTNRRATAYKDVSGESVRQDIVENQAGVPLTLDLQVVDMATCDPIAGSYLEIWRASTVSLFCS